MLRVGGTPGDCPSFEHLNNLYSSLSTTPVLHCSITPNEHCWLYVKILGLLNPSIRTIMFSWNHYSPGYGFQQVDK